MLAAIEVDSAVEMIDDEGEKRGWEFVLSVVEVSDSDAVVEPAEDVV